MTERLDDVRKYIDFVRKYTGCKIPIKKKEEKYEKIVWPNLKKEVQH